LIFTYTCTLYTRARPRPLSGGEIALRDRRSPRARRPARPHLSTERITRIFLHLRITRGARGRAGVGSVVLRYFYRCIQTRVRTRKSSPPRRFQSYSSRWGIGETTTSAHRPERGRWEVGKRYTRHCTRTRPATCVLACEAVIRSRLSHLPLCQLLSQLLSATSGLGIQSILRRIGYGYR
jgi:hypothetical protein